MKIPKYFIFICNQVCTSSYQVNCKYIIVHQLQTREMLHEWQENKMQWRTQSNTVQAQDDSLQFIHPWGSPAVSQTRT
jgi:hypothetical protein